MGSGFSIGLLDKLVGLTHRLVVVCVTSRWVRNVFLDGGVSGGWKLFRSDLSRRTPYFLFGVAGRKRIILLGWVGWIRYYRTLVKSKGARANATSQKKREQIHYS